MNGVQFHIDAYVLLDIVVKADNGARFFNYIRHPPKNVSYNKSIPYMASFSSGGLIGLELKFFIELFSSYELLFNYPSHCCY